MQQSPIAKVTELGQSIWLDFLSRNFVASGKLKDMVRNQHLRGVTSNPKIFSQSISEGRDYDEDIRKWARKGKNAHDIYEAVAVQDVQNAADLLRSVYESADGRDGFVSLEVSPLLAYDTRQTIDEARRLWKALSRPNVFIKVPATEEGLPAIRQLIGEGVNVNVTLLFGLPRYQEVIEAYVAGLEDRSKKSQPLSRVASVASFFLSRIDALVDKELDHLAAGGELDGKLARLLRGTTAIASAKIAYRTYKETFDGERWASLARLDARPQKLLWGSTSTKDPSYSDVMYVDALIGPDTINTVPLDTFEAYQDHGNPALRLEQNLEEALWRLTQLPLIGIDLNRMTQRLVDDGVKKFAEPFRELLSNLDQKRKAA